MGFFTISFTFPLLAEHMGYGTSFLGFLGIFIGIPFAVFALFMKRLDLSILWKIIRYATIVMLPASLFFVFVDPVTLVPLILLADLSAAAFFVAAEMGIGQSQTEKLAERYSAAWGIPNLVAPLIAGYILQISSFAWLYGISLVFFVAAVMFVPRLEKARGPPRVDLGSKLSMSYLFPLLFAGISAGFFYYVLIPYFKSLGTSYFLVGVIGSVPAITSAIGFLILERMRTKAWLMFALASALLLSLPVILLLSHGLVVTTVIFALSGIGSAIAFSKLLAYISKSSSASEGVFYYELLFGIGFIIGSLTGGFLFQFYGFVGAIMIFVPSLVYAIMLPSLGRASVTSPE